jgi:hypothetical protein
MCCRRQFEVEEGVRQQRLASERQILNEQMALCMPVLQGQVRRVLTALKVMPLRHQRADAARELARHLRRALANDRYIYMWLEAPATFGEESRGGGKLGNSGYSSSWRAGGGGASTQMPPCPSKAGLWIKGCVLDSLEQLDRHLKHRFHSPRNTSHAQLPQHQPFNPLHPDPSVLHPGHTGYGARYPGFFLQKEPQAVSQGKGPAGTVERGSYVRGQVGGAEEVLEEFAVARWSDLDVTASGLSLSLLAAPSAALWAPSVSSPPSSPPLAPLTPTSRSLQSLSLWVRATESAAISLQRLVRGQLARRRLKSFLNIMAAVRLQRVLRGHLARRAVRHVHLHRAYVSERAAHRAAAAKEDVDDGAPPLDLGNAREGARKASLRVSSGGRVWQGRDARVPRYWDDGGAGYLVGSWANALWTPPDLRPTSPGLDV